jgi:pimeloyl-ACP methyl ester carboxylesterase
VVLWRSRRAGRSRTRRYLRRVLLGVLGLVVLGEVVTPLAATYAMIHVAGAAVPEPELGAAYEDVTFTTSDGLELEGWYVPSRNGAAVIAFPGRSGPQLHTRMLVEHGYGVLLFDRRGEGASEGDGNKFGWGGERDIHAAIDFLKDRPDVDPERIGGIGLSVGGELMLQAAAENPDLAAVVSEGAGTRSFSEEKVDYGSFMVARGIHQMVLKQAGLALFSNEPPPPSLVDLAPRIGPRPVLLIWAPNGGNREAMNPLYQALIGPSAEIWSIPDAQHVKGLQTHPEEYERRVVDFFDAALVETR